MELVFGGSFDPPTLAHVQQSHIAMSQCNAQYVRFIPAGRSPHKLNHVQADPCHRLEMLRLALSDCRWAIIDEREVRLGNSKPTFTIDTLRALQAEDPSTQRHLLFGSDQLAAFHMWHQWQDIESIAPPRVMLRPPTSEDELLASLPETWDRALWRSRLVQIPLSSTSSTQVRQYLRDGKPTNDLLHPEVAAYIRCHNLYK